MEPDFFGLFFYLFALILNSGFIFLDVYFLSLFSDLETDNINPIDMCKHINLFILPGLINYF